MIALTALLPPRERIQPLALVGLFIGFLGILVLLMPELKAPQDFSASFWWSTLLCLFMVFFWALGSIFVRKTQSNASILMGLGIQNLFAGMLLIPVTMLTVDFWQISPSFSSVLGLLYLVVFGTIIATTCYYYVLKELPVSVSSTFSYVTPLITVLFGWLFLGELITSYTLAGSGVILMGVFLVQYASIKPSQVKPIQAQESKIQIFPNKRSPRLDIPREEKRV
jgi:drug/metabolite transporter (DMT)-like permease